MPLYGQSALSSSVPIPSTALEVPPQYSTDQGYLGETRICADGLYIYTNSGWRKVDVASLPAETLVDLDVANFQIRAINNNGGTPLNSIIISAVDVFVKSLKTDNIWNLLIDIGIYVGDNLASAITKLKYSASKPSSYINNGFTDNDYSENTGLQGGLNKYLDSGITANSLNANSVYFAGYVSGDCSGQTPSFFGTPERPNNNEDNFKLYVNYQGYFYGGLFFHQVFAQATLTQGGFYAISKVSESNAFFQGNDTQNSITVTTTARTEPVLFFADRGGYFDKALKFSCIGYGLSMPQSLTLKNRVLELQQALNRA